MIKLPQEEKDIINKQLKSIEECDFTDWDSEYGSTFNQERLVDTVRILATIIKKLIND